MGYLTITLRDQINQLDDSIITIYRSTPLAPTHMTPHFHTKRTKSNEIERRKKKIRDPDPEKIE